MLACDKELIEEIDRQARERMALTGGYLIFVCDIPYPQGLSALHRPGEQPEHDGQQRR